MGELFADAAVRAIVLRTILISGTATALAVLVGVPAGYVIARKSFPGRTILLGFINTSMGIPPVVVGLVVWVLLVRSGRFGDLGLIYTRQAMVLAQFMIATPIVMGFTTASFQALSPQLPDLETAPPPEFDGPGGLWSPENLLCAAVADCFILTFRAIASFSRLSWRVCSSACAS